MGLCLLASPNMDCEVLTMTTIHLGVLACSSDPGYHRHRRIATRSERLCLKNHKFDKNHPKTQFFTIYTTHDLESLEDY